MRGSGTCALRRPAGALIVVGLMSGLFTLPAWGDSLAWRQTSVMTSREAGVTVRRGVALFSTGEPATLTVRLKGAGAPIGRSMPVDSEMVFQFDDGSTLRLAGQSTVTLSPEGMPMRGEAVNGGSITGGTGRFSGATGSYRMRVRTDIDGSADGALGDYFATCEATFSLPR